MILSKDQVGRIVHGVLTLTESNGTYSFTRFTERQLAYYARLGGLWVTKSKASSGLSLDFITDADNLSFDFTAEYGSSRSYWFIDGMIDGTPVLHVGNEKAPERDLGHFSMDIPEGEHRVTVRFTGISRFTLSSIALSDGAELREVKKKHRILLLGDSITQGYDAYHPSMHYANRLTDALEAEGLNQAIGGEVFAVDLLPDELKDAFSPDLITVAYGTNDWSRRPADLFDANANAFFGKLRSLYPDTPILCLLPIWRGDLDKEHDPSHRTFDGMRTALAEIAEKHDATVVDTLSFVPHLSECFWDGWLHPNDLGFLPYGEAVISAVKPYLHN